MATHGLNSQNHVQYLLPGQENALRVEDSTELIYLEEGAELNTHTIDGVEYLFVDENQQIIDPHLVEGEEQYIEEDDTCNQYLQIENNDPMQYINTEYANSVPLDHSDQLLQYVEDISGNSKDISQQILYTDAEGTIEYIEPTNTDVFNQDLSQVQYIEAPTLEPEIPVEYMDGVDTGYQYAEPPTLEPETAFVDSQQEYNDATTTDTNQEPLYIQHEGVLYQINDPALMTPDALAVIKATLLDKTSEGDSDKENSTSNAHGAEEVHKASAIEYTENTEFCTNNTNSTNQVYTLVSDMAKQCDNPTPKHVSNTFKQSITYPSKKPNPVSGNLNTVVAGKNGVSLLPPMLHSLVSQKANTAESLVNRLQAKPKRNENQVMTSAWHNKNDSTYMNGSKRQNQTLTSSAQKGFVGQYNNIVVKAAVSNNLKGGHSLVQTPYSPSIHCSKTSSVLPKSQSKSLSVVKSPDHGSFNSKSLSVIKATDKSGFKTADETIKCDQPNNLTKTISPGMSVKKISPQSSEIINSPKSPNYSTSVKKIYDPKSSAVVTLTFNGTKAHTESENAEKIVCKISQMYSKTNSLPIEKSAKSTTVKGSLSMQNCSQMKVSNAKASSSSSLKTQEKSLECFTNVKENDNKQTPIGQSEKSLGKVTNLKVYNIQQSKSVKPLNKKNNTFVVNNSRKLPSPPLCSKLNDKKKGNVNNRLSLENYLKSRMQGPSVKLKKEIEADLRERSASNLSEIKKSSSLTTSCESRNLAIKNSEENDSEIANANVEIQYDGFVNECEKAGLLNHSKHSPVKQFDELGLKCSDFMCQINMDSLGKPKNRISQGFSLEISKISETQRTYDRKVHRGTQTSFVEVIHDYEKSSVEDPLYFDMECEEIMDKTAKKGLKKKEKTLIGRGSQSNSPVKEDKKVNKQNHSSVESQVFENLKSRLQDLNENSTDPPNESPEKISAKRFYKSSNVKDIIQTIFGTKSETPTLDSDNDRTSDVSSVKTNSGNITIDMTEEPDVSDSNDIANNYEVGEDCKAKHLDGNIYDGIITQVDACSQRCYIDFLDKGCAWCEFKDVESVVLEDNTENKNKLEEEGCDIVCSLCDSGDSKAYNEIVLCDGCGKGYHQTCHSPAIDCSVILDFESEWVCSVCRPPTPTDYQATPLPYEPASLTWNDNHTENMEKCYCYCGKTGNWFMQMLQCRKCQQWFHQDCVSCLSEALIMGDQFYVFVCTQCNRGSEFLHRLHLRWVDIAHLAIFHLSLSLGKKGVNLDEEIWPWVNKQWKQIKKANLFECNKQRRLLKLQETLTDVHWTKRFRNGREIRKDHNLWSLRVRTPPPAPVVKMPLMKPLTAENTANFKWKIFHKLPNGPCEPIDWKFARPSKLKLPRKRKLSGSDTEAYTKKRKLGSDKYELTGKISSLAELDSSPKSLLEKLIPVQQDYEYVNHPFLLEVEKTELEKRGLWKAQVVEKSTGMTLLTVTDNAMFQHSGDNEDVDEEAEPYLVLGKRNSKDQLNYLIQWL